MPLSLTDARAKVAALQTALDQNQGRIDGLMENLATEFDCKTVKKAEGLLKRLDHEWYTNREAVAIILRDLETEVLAAEESVSED